MPPSRLAGFAIVWLALIVFTVDGMRHSRRQLHTAALAATPQPTAATTR
jgi:chloramphenicol-sensitive protein RarD